MGIGLFTDKHYMIIVIALTLLLSFVANNNNALLSFLIRYEILNGRIGGEYNIIRY